MIVRRTRVGCYVYFMLFRLYLLQSGIRSDQHAAIQRHSFLNIRGNGIQIVAPKSGPLLENTVPPDKHSATLYKTNFHRNAAPPSPPQVPRLDPGGTDP